MNTKGYSLFKRKGTGRHALWYVLRREDDGHRKAYSTGCRDRSDAEVYAEKHFHKSGKVPTLEEYADKLNLFQEEKCTWLERHRQAGKPIAKNTIRIYAMALSKIIRQFGACRLTDIERRDLEGWLFPLKCSPMEKNVIKGVGRLLYKEAIDEKIISDNPFSAVIHFAVGKSTRTIYSMEEIKTLFPIDENELFRVWGSQMKSTAFLLLAGTGMRSAECRALAWRHYFPNGNKPAILIERQLQFNVLTQTKGKQDRVILVPGRVAMALDSWRIVSPYGMAEDYIFCNSEGKPVGPKSLGVWMHSAMGRVGIEAKGRAVHSWRHTYTTAVRRSMTPESFGTMIGHRDQKTTDGYDHPALTARIEALEPARAGIQGILPEKTEA